MPTGKGAHPQDQDNVLHPKDEDRNTAPHQKVPGRKMLKTHCTPQGPQDQDAGSLSNSNPAGAHNPDPTSSPAQVCQQGKKRIPETQKTLPHQKNENKDTAPRQDARSPSDPIPIEPSPRSPHLPQPKRASREGGQLSETPDV